MTETKLDAACRTFKVRRSAATVVFTLGYFAAFAGVLALGVAHPADSPRPVWYVVVAVMAAAAVAAFVFTARYIDVTDRDLVIRRTVGRLRIPLGDIEVAELVGLPPTGHAPLLAAGSLFSNVGWYYSRSTGRYLSYAASATGTVLLSLKNGRRYMVSCDEPEALLRCLGR